MATAAATAVKRLHDERRAAGVCINNAAHGAAVKAGRCQTCLDSHYAQKRAAKKKATAARREAREREQDARRMAEDTLRSMDNQRTALSDEATIDLSMLCQPEGQQVAETSTVDVGSAAVASA